MTKKNPLIINGKVLAEVGDTPTHGGDSKIEERKFKRSFSEAQEYVLPQITQLKKDIGELEEYNRIRSIYFRVSYPHQFLAKTYQVSSIYKDSKVKLIGSCQWIDDEDKEGRSDFLMGTEENINSLKQIIESTVVQVQQKEIRRIDEISLLKPTITIGKDDTEENLYELSFYSVIDPKELLKKFEELLDTNPNNYEVLQETNGVLFIVAKLTKNELEKIKDFNPLRASYPVNNRDFISASFSKENIRNYYISQDLDKDEQSKLPWIGLIDGGVVTNEEFFSTVEQVYESEANSSEEYIEHGTSVASIILYGDLEKDGHRELLPSFRLQSVRALPSELDMEFNLLTVDRLIQEIVPRFPHIKIWNLSIGPQGPILDDVVSSLTRILDRLSYENNIIFVIAAGNTGTDSGFSRRIQIPGDSVNNITVSAYYRLEEKTITAQYSSLGPGREGAKLKPDIIDHGGLLPVDPVYTISSYGYFLNKVHGTSFAAPHVTRKLGLILASYPELNVWQARALLEHSLALNISSKRDISIDSKGELNAGEEQLLFSNEDEVRILYSGNISSKGYVVLPVPLPEETMAKSATITWTLVTKTKVNPDCPDKYTEYGIEDDFYPNAEKYTFRHSEKSSPKDVDVSTEEGQELFETLLQEGYKKSSYPKKENPKYIDESKRRRDFLKWDTVKTQKVNKRISSLNKPFIRLHGLARSDRRERIEYALVVTVRYKDDIQMYANVMNKYPILQPIILQNNVSQRI